MVAVADKTKRYPLSRVHADGYFESVLRGVDAPF